MATWIDGGSNPPRPGYYAEYAERALEADVSVGRGPSARYRERALVFATLELAAATERAAVASYDRIQGRG